MRVDRDDPPLHAIASGSELRQRDAHDPAAGGVDLRLPGAHSIWELVHHITAWVDIARQRVEGTDVKVTQDINFPPVTDGSEDSWRASVARMEQAEAALRETIAGIAEARLDEPAVPGGDSVYILLHGAVQHSLYHAGQIILLKRFWTRVLKPPGA